MAESLLFLLYSIAARRLNASTKQVSFQFSTGNKNGIVMEVNHVVPHLTSTIRIIHEEYGIIFRPSYAPARMFFPTGHVHQTRLLFGGGKTITFDTSTCEAFHEYPRVVLAGDIAYLWDGGSLAFRDSTHAWKERCSRKQGRYLPLQSIALHLSGLHRRYNPKYYHR